MKVQMKARVQHKARVYEPGETTDMPDGLAKALMARELVEEAPKKKAKPKADPKGKGGESKAKEEGKSAE